MISGSSYKDLIEAYQIRKEIREGQRIKVYYMGEEGPASCEGILTEQTEGLPGVTLCMRSDDGKEERIYRLKPWRWEILG